MAEPPTPAVDRETDGRTDQTQDHDRNGWWRGGVARTVYLVAGTAFGLVTSLASVRRGSELWAVWACLAIGLTAASGAVFGYGLTGWAEIVALGSI
jgi:hypothetical protein